MLTTLDPIAKIALLMLLVGCTSSPPALDQNDAQADATVAIDAQADATAAIDATLGCSTACDDGDPCTHDVCNIVDGVGVCAHTNVNACATACGNTSTYGYADRDADDSTTRGKPTLYRQ